MKPRTANSMNIQIFGTKKCNDTKKAQRFFKERGIKFQFIDMKEKGMSKGEYTSVKQAVGGLDAMLNADCKDKDALDAIASVLPAGTLSGAPKIRACEIIDELEKEPRGIYGGALGYIDFSGNLDTCIAIRMAVKKNGKV